MISAAVITNSPAPYRDQLYRQLVCHFASLRVYYTEPESSDRGWEIDEGCPTERLKTTLGLGSTCSLQPGVIRAVRNADVVFVGGYETLTYVAAMVVGRLTGRRVVLFFDGIAPSRLSRRGFRYQLKRWLVRVPHVCLVNGQISREYFERVLGVPADRLRNQYLVPVRADEVAAASERVDVLFVGRLVERKGVDDLLDALRLAPELSADVVGDGPERQRLESSSHGLRIRFSGEATRSEIDARMRTAGCLVMPSRDEPWGLVVHEAIQCNLPVVVSDDVGSALDLVVEGVNGCVFPSGDVAGFVASIKRALDLDPDLVAEANCELMKAWSLGAHVDAFVGAASAKGAVGSPRSPCEPR